MGEQVQQTGKEKEEDPAFFIFEQFIIYAACFLLETKKNLSEEEQANIIYAWTDYAKAFGFKERVLKRKTELAENASVTPWERPEIDNKYYQNYIVPAFMKTFGRIATNSTSYVMSNEGAILLFNTNDPNLFVQELFGNQEFRELLKKSLQNEPLYEISKTRQMEIEFQTIQDFAEIEGGFFRRDKLVQIFHILRADTLQLYFLIDEVGHIEGRPLLISDGFGHFIALPPVEKEEEEEEEEPTSEARSVPPHEEQRTPSSPLGDTQSEALVEDRQSPDPNLIIERHKRIIELRQKGKSYRRIARIVKISKSTVALELKHHRELSCGCENPKTEAHEKLS
jgi:hypothetical protein